ncbi:MAG: hypothetical protein JWN04_204, partial [Myxococcaceae bacterium]|nr:hypothetical protein [Myxococcaceae bacterium]
MTEESAMPPPGKFAWTVKALSLAIT